jgi:putative protein kinase ArgK-like GTPase of G3E family
MTPAIRRHIAESRARFDAKAEMLNAAKTEMTARHRDGREKLDTRQRAEWDAETLARAARLPKGVKSLWSRITGAYCKIKRENEAEAAASRTRQADDRQTLADAQFGERERLQAKIKKLRRDQASQLRELRADIGRYLRFTRGESAPPRSLSPSLSLKLGH